MRQTLWIKNGWDCNKELFAQISDKTESLVSQTDEIKQNLANVTKDIEKLPDTSVLEDSLQSLFNKLDSLEKDIEKRIQLKIFLI